MSKVALGDARTNILKRMNKNNRSVAILFFIILIGVIVISIFEPNFLTTRNIFNVLLQVSAVGIVTMGTAVVLISGCIDLSIGYLFSVAGTVGALMVVSKTNDAVIILATLAVGILGGFINGIIVSKTRVESFIITLGMMSVYRGLALILTGGNNVYLQNRFTWIGKGRIGIVPVPVIIFLFIILLTFSLMRFTKFGRKVYAVGGNEEAAYLAGINVNLIKIVVYMINGLFAGVASLIMISRIGQSQPSVGADYPLEAIASAVIGGVALAGGRGTVQGTFLGVILMGLINNSLNMLHVPSFYQYVTLGTIIILAIILSNIGSNKRR